MHRCSAVLSFLCKCELFFTDPMEIEDTVTTANDIILKNPKCEQSVSKEIKMLFKKYEKTGIPVDVYMSGLKTQMVNIYNFISD